MSIDRVWSMDTSAGYTSIELELNKPQQLKQMNNYRLELLDKNKEIITEWKYSKFQMCEAIKELEIKTNPLSTEDIHKIVVYMGNRKKY